VGQSSVGLTADLSL